MSHDWEDGTAAFLREINFSFQLKIFLTQAVFTDVAQLHAWLLLLLLQ